MAITKTDIAKLYIGIFDRMPDGESLENYYNIAVNQSEEAAVESMIEHAKAYPDLYPDIARFNPANAESVEAVINDIYKIVFNKDKTIDPDGIKYWTNEIVNGNMTLSQALVTIKNAAAQYLTSDNYADKAAAQAFENKAEVALYTAEKYKSDDLNEDGKVDYSKFKNIIELITHDELSVKTAKKAVDNISTFDLTLNPENVTATYTDDLIKADVVQNAKGEIVNTLSTGDVINGLEGTDTLYAKVLGEQESSDDSENREINPVTKNVEIAKFQTVGANPVTIDAGEMDSVKEYWDVNSDFNSSLTIRDIRLGSLETTKDLTFELQNVDYNHNFTATLDSQSFIPPKAETVNSKIDIKVADASPNVDPNKPLENVKLTVSFEYNNQNYTLTVTSPDGTYNGLKTALSEALEDAGLTNLVVEEGSTFNELNGVQLSYEATEFFIVDKNGKEFDNVSGSLVGKSGSSGVFLYQVQPYQPEVINHLIETNLILDNVGRSSTAGDVVIGAMSNSDKGIEQFDIKVDRDSAINSLSTTNNKLQKIVISSLENKGDLEIAHIDNSILSSIKTNSLVIDATNFKGENLLLGGTNEIAFANSHVTDLKELDANIDSNVTVYFEIQAADNQADGINYKYTTGSGDDTINASIDGDNIDAYNESLTITTNGGDDEVTVKDQDLIHGVSYQTMNKLNNLTINVGSGDDDVNIKSYKQFNINLNSGDDFIEVDADNNIGTASQWTVFNASQKEGDIDNIVVHKEADNNTDDNSTTDSTIYIDKNNKLVLNLTLDGFEYKKTLSTSKDYKDYDINKEIKSLIESDDFLSDVLKVQEGSGTELIITSKVDGKHTLSINLQEVDSDDNVKDSVLLVNSIESGDNTPIVNNKNYSSIIAGSGDDVLVLDSNAASSNVIDLTSSFDTIKVLNFDKAYHTLKLAKNGYQAITFTNNSDAKFKNITADVVKQAINGEKDYSNLTSSNLSSVTDSTDEAFTKTLLIENGDNPGEFKVFNISSPKDDNSKVESVTYLGTIDFGNELTASDISDNIVFGTDANKDDRSDLMKVSDDFDSNAVWLSKYDKTTIDNVSYVEDNIVVLPETNITFKAAYDDNDTTINITDDVTATLDSSVSLTNLANANSLKIKNYDADGDSLVFTIDNGSSTVNDGSTLNFTNYSFDGQGYIKVKTTVAGTVTFTSTNLNDDVALDIKGTDNSADTIVLENLTNTNHKIDLTETNQAVDTVVFGLVTLDTANKKLINKTGMSTIKGLTSNNTDDKLDFSVVDSANGLGGKIADDDGNGNPNNITTDNDLSDGTADLAGKMALIKKSNGVLTADDITATANTDNKVTVGDNGAAIIIVYSDDNDTKGNVYVVADVDSGSGQDYKVDQIGVIDGLKYGDIDNSTYQNDVLTLAT